MCEEWQPIETAPKDGTVLMLKRVYQGAVIAQGEGLFGRLHDDAPSRVPLGVDPLGRLTPADYACEARNTAEWAASAKWLRKGSLYAFPMPTHWKRVTAPS